jgi:hypothetical protein
VIRIVVLAMMLEIRIEPIEVLSIEQFGLGSELRVRGKGKRNTQQKKNETRHS